MDTDNDYNFSAFDGKGKINFKVDCTYFEKLPLQIMVKREVQQFKKKYWMVTSLASAVVGGLFLLLTTADQSTPLSFGEEQAVYEEYLYEELSEDELIDLDLSANYEIN